MNHHHETDPNLDPLDHPQVVDQLDQILSNEPPLLPTSGFALSVMDSIRVEAAQPAPKFSSAIKFPWARLLPGTILALALLVWLMWKYSPTFLADLHSATPQLAQHTTFHLTPPIITAGWLLLAVAASLLPLLFVRRLMGRSALL